MTNKGSVAYLIINDPLFAIFWLAAIDITIVDNCLGEFAVNSAVPWSVSAKGRNGMCKHFHQDAELQFWSIPIVILIIHVPKNIGNRCC